MPGSCDNTSRLLATAFSFDGCLRYDVTYFAKRFDSMLRVQAKKSASMGVPCLIVKPSKMPYEKRGRRILEKERAKHKQIIRERQSCLDPAEDVIVMTDLEA